MRDFTVTRDKLTFHTPPAEAFALDFLIESRLNRWMDFLTDLFCVRWPVCWILQLLTIMERPGKEKQRKNDEKTADTLQICWIVIKFLMCELQRVPRSAWNWKQVKVQRNSNSHHSLLTLLKMKMIAAPEIFTILTRSWATKADYDYFVKEKKNYENKRKFRLLCNSVRTELIKISFFKFLFLFFSERLCNSRK